jgi:PAS domain-containing protein
LVAPLHELSEASRRVATGDFSARVPVDAPNELGELGQAFNEMTQQLQAHNDYILESMGNGLVVVDLNGRITTFNRAASRMLKVSAAEAIGRPIEAVFGRYPVLARRIDAAVWEGARLKDLEINLSDEDPTIVRLQTGAVQGGGPGPGTEILLTDQTQVRRLEARVKVTEKMATIGELAADRHEIRNPLGAMKGFTEISQRRLGTTRGPRRSSRTSPRRSRSSTRSSRISRVRRPRTWSAPLGPHRAVRSILPSSRRTRSETGEGGLPRGPIGDRDLGLGTVPRAVLNVALNAIQASPEGASWNCCRGFHAGDCWRPCKGATSRRSSPTFPRSFAVIQVLDGARSSPGGHRKALHPLLHHEDGGFWLGLSITRKILERMVEWWVGARGRGGLVPHGGAGPRVRKVRRLERQVGIEYGGWT